MNYTVDDLIRFRKPWEEELATNEHSVAYVAQRCIDWYDREIKFQTEHQYNQDAAIKHARENS